MSQDTEEKKRPGVSKFYYWAKQPPKSLLFPGGFVNKQQKRFYIVIAGLNVAKVVAILLIFFLIIGRI
jgi:hypothetical protein